MSKKTNAERAKNQLLLRLNSLDETKEPINTGL